jgi:nicotinate-nucleotide adenylyltransferase
LAVGILGGIFNPPHIGHLVCAQEAYIQLGLDAVVLMPVGQAPHRDMPDDPGAEVRLQMCELAVAGDERLRVSRLEIDRPGPSYTVDTLRDLQRQAPEQEVVWIMGADQAEALPRWREPEAVLELARVGVAERDGRRRDEVRAAVAGLEGAGERLGFFDMPRIDVSSTMVRERAATGRPIRYLVPDEVANFIGAQSLYGASTSVVGR